MAFGPTMKTQKLDLALAPVVAATMAFADGRAQYLGPAPKRY